MVDPDQLLCSGPRRQRLVGEDAGGYESGCGFGDERELLTAECGLCVCGFDSECAFVGEDAGGYESGCGFGDERELLTAECGLCVCGFDSECAFVGEDAGGYESGCASVMSANS